MGLRPVVAIKANGENASEPRARLAASIARAHVRLGAEKTLYDMLRLAVRRDPLAFQAVQRALRSVPR